MCRKCLRAVEGGRRAGQEEGGTGRRCNTEDFAWRRPATALTQRPHLIAIDSIASTSYEKATAGRRKIWWRTRISRLARKNASVRENLYLSDICRACLYRALHRAYLAVPWRGRGMTVSEGEREGRDEETAGCLAPLLGQQSFYKPG